MTISLWKIYFSNKHSSQCPKFAHWCTASPCVSKTWKKAIVAKLVNKEMTFILNCYILICKWGFKNTINPNAEIEASNWTLKLVFILHQRGQQVAPCTGNRETDRNEIAIGASKCSSLPHKFAHIQCLPPWWNTRKQDSRFGAKHCVFKIITHRSCEKTLKGFASIWSNCPNPTTPTRRGIPSFEVVILWS